MKRYVKYDYNRINQFVDRALDIRNNQFANWQTIFDITEDENIQNLGEVMFGRDFYSDINYQESVRRVFEEIKLEEI